MAEGEQLDLQRTAEELAAQMESDGRLRDHVAHEVLLSRETIATLRQALDTERHRTDVALRAMAVPPEREGPVQRAMHKAIPVLVVFVGGMVAFVLLSLLFNAR